jgi:hypothetical protein
MAGAGKRRRKGALAVLLIMATLLAVAVAVASGLALIFYRITVAVGCQFSSDVPGRGCINTLSWDIGAANLALLALLLLAAASVATARMRKWFASRS